MSRIAKAPVELNGATVTLTPEQISVKGGAGELSMPINSKVEVKQDDNVLTFTPKDGSKGSIAMAGTTRALVNNMVVGVTKGWERKLQLLGVGYRAAVQGDKLNLTLGFSHPVEYLLPAGVKAQCTSQTDITLTSANKQLLGQVAAEIRAFRPPEPYKGKGVRYADERVRRKEAKKK